MTTITHEPEFEVELDNHGSSAAPNMAQDSPIEKRRSLSSVLRMFGACAVIASLSLFLIEGWSDGNDLNRYLKLLAQTGLITGAGIFLSFVVKEVKGARVFFGLSLVSAVANFTILGALAYSIFQLDGALGDYPSMLQWQAVSLTHFIPLALGAVALLALLARFSFGIFARNSAGKLTLSFLLLNALLLIPVREAAYVSILAAVALLAATRITLGIIRRRELLFTLEAKYALACLFLPGLIIVTRALGLYAVDELVLLTIFSLLYYALRSISLLVQNSSSSRASTQKLLVLARYGSGLISAGLVCSLIPAQYDVVISALFSLITLAITLDVIQSQTEPDNALSRALVSVSTLSLLFLNISQALFSASVLVTVLNLSSLIALLAVIQLVARGLPNLRRDQLLTLIGVAAIALLLIVRLVALVDVGSWILIGGLGIALILAASMYERYGLIFKLPSSDQKT